MEAICAVRHAKQSGGFAMAHGRGAGGGHRGGTDCGRRALRLWTRSLVRPINEINLENPLQNRVYDELTPMLRRMAEQNRRLETQMREIDARRGELETIIGHMNEGLLILDAHRHVLLMNDSARAILHTGLPADG